MPDEVFLLKGRTWSDRKILRVREALRLCFPSLEVILELGQEKRLPRADILDAAAAYWSAVRLAERRGFKPIAIAA